MDEGAAALSWLLEEMERELPTPPVQRSLLAELWRFLMHKHAHRAAAARRDPSAVAAIVASMEAHPRDAAVLRGGFGCLCLLGADKASYPNPNFNPDPNYQPCPQP